MTGRDPTPRASRALRGHLEPNETIVAAVHAQRPGTLSASIDYGTSAGLGAAIGDFAARAPRGGDAARRWATHLAVVCGIDPALARRTIFVTLALTPRRLLLVRRGSLHRRPAELLAAWPLAETTALEIPRGSQRLRLRHGTAQLELELPKALKHLPDVYRELPRSFDRLRAEERLSAGPGGADSAGSSARTGS